MMKDKVEKAVGAFYIHYIIIMFSALHNELQHNRSTEMYFDSLRVKGVFESIDFKQVYMPRVKKEPYKVLRDKLCQLKDNFPNSYTELTI